MGSAKSIKSFTDSIKKRAIADKRNDGRAYNLFNTTHDLATVERLDLDYPLPSPPFSRPRSPSQQMSLPPPPRPPPKHMRSHPRLLPSPKSAIPEHSEYFDTYREPAYANRIARSPVPSKRSVSGPISRPLSPPTSPSMSMWSATLSRKSSSVASMSVSAVADAPSRPPVNVPRSARASTAFSAASEFDHTPQDLGPVYESIKVIAHRPEDVTTIRAALSHMQLTWSLYMELGRPANLAEALERQMGVLSEAVDRLSDLPPFTITVPVRSDEGH